MKKPVKYMKRENVVLTQDHKDRVLARLEEVQQKVKKLWGKDVPIPTVTYDLKGLVAGLAYAHQNKIRLHPIFLCENESDYIYDTVAHEYAHIIVHHTHTVPKGKKKIMAHGAEWQDVMSKIGLGPKAGKSWADVIKHKYNPSSIEQKPKRKYGPRKPGGRTVGELMLKIKKLSAAELTALCNRLGVQMASGAAFAEPAPLTDREIKAWQEERKLNNLLHEDFTHLVPQNTVSTAGWAQHVIEHLSSR